MGAAVGYVTASQKHRCSKSNNETKEEHYATKKKTQSITADTFRRRSLEVCEERGKKVEHGNRQTPGTSTHVHRSKNITTTAMKKKPSALKKQQERGDAFTALVTQRLGVQAVKEYQFAPPRRWRFDYAIPSVKIALEVEGGVWTRGRHTRPKGFLSDMEKYNAAAVAGWKVLRTVPGELFTMTTLNLLHSAISFVKAEK